MKEETADKPLLLKARQAAKLCGTSESTWRMWYAAGYNPLAVRLGKSLFWRAKELEAWVEAGCPKREDWIDLQSA